MKRTRLCIFTITLVCYVGYNAECVIADEDVPKGATEEKNAKEKDAGEPIFDGKSLDGWKETDFAGKGKVKVQGGELVLGHGEMLTGVTYDGKPPKNNYEISLEAKRVDGSDFFCGLTFPVGDEFCSLILGGWGGSLCGLSCLDDSDASENKTTYFEKFESGKWHTVRVRVTDAKIEAWVNGERTVNVDREGIKFSVRWEIELSRPLGLATYQTTAALRDIRLKKIKPE